MRNNTINKRKIWIIFIAIVIAVGVLLTGHHVAADNNERQKELEQKILDNNAKISDIQIAKDQLHATADMFRNASINDDSFVTILGDKWNELHDEEKVLNDSNNQYRAEIEKIKSRRIFKGKFELTAYCYGSRTATGTTPTANRTIAVDPKIIPYGTKVEIEGYGTYVAEDCGGAVKGNVIDIYIPGYKNCINFGRRHANVYIINE